ncbi:MAG: hypothetical protein COA78_10675 [Blastopirellula sp.]|nr:MAG: hypothetical protein COA78_10675 [Blastopirellula sp.]
MPHSSGIVRIKESKCITLSARYQQKTEHPSLLQFLPRKTPNPRKDFEVNPVRDFRVFRGKNLSFLLSGFEA